MKIRSAKKLSYLCLRGIITPEEFASNLADAFAYYPLASELVADIVALIPASAWHLVLEKCEIALAPGYPGRHFVGTRASEEELRRMRQQHADQERAWSAAILPVMRDSKEQGLHEIAKVVVPSDVEAEVMALIAQRQPVPAKERLEQIGMDDFDASAWVNQHIPYKEWYPPPPPPVPCPYCGELLKSAFAQQCLTCGMDWHDPSNPVRRGP